MESMVTGDISQHACSRNDTSHIRTASFMKYFQALES